jgi:15-cis-phytoene synthase
VVVSGYPADLLAASYRRCQELHRAHGRTYYLATRLLPRNKRRHVHALYGFTRYTDEIVDRLDGAPTAVRAAALRGWADRFRASLDPATPDPSKPGEPAPDRREPDRRDLGDEILPAVLHTIKVFDLDRADFAAFLHSMEMDLSVTEYPTYDDLLEYMAGSAAAIGTMMLPILGARDVDRAREPARQLGIAFQLTNFIRDVSEDLVRGRIYLPVKDLAQFGGTAADLREQRATEPIRRLIAFEVDRARQHYARAAPGIAMLDAGSQACIRTASRLYAGILDEVVRADYDVFGRRARVSNRRRLAVAVGSMLTRPGRPEPPIEPAPATGVPRCGP